MKIVAFGGGTGLSTLLRGLKLFSVFEVTAVVTVTDEGGSSGIIREELGVLPPGDLRNNIIALAEDESLMSKIMAYRFIEGQTLKNHSLGNLIIAALTKITGSFAVAIEKASSILAIKGKVLPVTEDSVRLIAKMETGEEIVGETEIVKKRSKILEIRLDKPARPFLKVIDSLTKCDAVILGPGSLFTSIIPNLLVSGVNEAMKGKPKILIANMMTQPGETVGFSLRDHITTVEKYLGCSLDRIIVNSETIPDEVLERYRSQRSEPIFSDGKDERVIPFPMVDVIIDPRDGKKKLRHDPLRLAASVRETVTNLVGD